MDLAVYVKSSSFSLLITVLNAVNRQHFFSVCVANINQGRKPILYKLHIFNNACCMSDKFVLSHVS